VERQYLELMRDYDTLQTQFADIQAKLSAASLAETLETEQRGERYTQIRSPSASARPYSPNRIGIILLGIVLGGALAVSIAAVVEASDPTIRSPRDLRDAADIQPIGTVPVMMNYSDHARRWVKWGAVTAVFAVATIFVGSVVLDDASRTEQAHVEQTAMERKG
jgi:polysaccharide biosynthesis transport protein